MSYSAGFSDSELSKQNERLALLASAAELLLSETNAQTMMDRLFDTIANHLQIDTTFNFMVHGVTDKLHLEFSRGLSESALAVCQTLDFGAAVCGRVAQERCPITVSNIQDSKEPMVQLVKSFGVRSYCCHPLVVGGTLLGTLSFASHTKDQFTPDEIDFMRTICHYVAMAKDRIRITEERLVVLEAERAARIDAERLSRLKDDFLGTLSHELTTPLNAILGWAQLLRTKSLAESDVRSAAEVIERNARIQAQVIEQLLDMSRMVSGSVTLSKRRVELAAIIEAAIGSLKPQIELKHLRVTKLIDPSLSPIRGDPERLEQAMCNILANAVKFTPPNGAIDLQAIRVGSELEIAITDSGIGVPEEFLPRMFDRFSQQNSTATRTVGGLGLGLAISKHIIQLHGGSIRAESEGENRGTKIVLAIPLEEAPQVIDTPAAQL